MQLSLIGVNSKDKILIG